MATETGSNHSKVHFSSIGELPIADKDQMYQTLDKEFAMVPKVFNILGEPGESGLAVVFNGTLVSTVKHPKLIAKSFDFEENRAEFFGNQTLEQVETSMAVPLGYEYAQQSAATLINDIKQRGLTDVVRETGFGTIGMEEEAHHYKKDGMPARLADEEQVELQEHVKETALEPTDNMFDQVLAVAQSRLNEAESHPDNLVLSTSFGMLAKPQDMRMNSGEYSAYVNAVVTPMFDNFFFPKDPVVMQYWNKIAQSGDYKNFYHMKESIGNLTPIAFSAAHVSMGLRSEEIEGSKAIGLEEGVAVADMVNSNFGTMLEWMTYSTPFAFGERIGVNIDGEMQYPKDARAVARLASRTTYPGEFIGTPKNYRDKIVNMLVTGNADRIDRAAYSVYHEDLDEEVASAHGRVRLRVTGGSGKEKFSKSLGRVEFTGGGETPDLEALFARNAMLKLMGVAAYEAVAEGKHPMKHFKYKFPSMQECGGHIELAHAYNFDGADHPKATNLLAEGRAFINYMREEYQHEEMQYLVDLAERGLNKLTEKTEARNLNEYLANPKGNISDVLTNMYKDGYSMLEIAEEIAEFEKKQSAKLIELNGDVLRLSKE